MHNLRTVCDERSLEQLWSTQIIPSCIDGEHMSTLVSVPSNAAPRSSTTDRSNSHKAGSCAANPRSGCEGDCEGAASSGRSASIARSHSVRWFKTASVVRHLAMVQQRSPFGESHNPAAMALLQGRNR